MQLSPAVTSSPPSRRRRLILTLASVGGLGYLPLAPGTWGSLAGLPLWALLAPWSLGEQVAAVAALTAFAVWVSQRAEAHYGRHDVQHIVIDEVVGMLTTTLGVPFSLAQLLPAFLLFRLLDAGKPGPIGWIDRHLGGGWGVVLDDTAAGLLGCALLHGVCWLLGGWW